MKQKESEKVWNEKFRHINLGQDLTIEEQEPLLLVYGLTGRNHCICRAFRACSFYRNK